MNRRESSLALAGLALSSVSASATAPDTYCQKRPGDFWPMNSAATATPFASGSPRRRPINPTPGSYAQAFEVTGAQRLLFISGQVPADDAGNVPADFRSQCRLAWTNVERQLRDAGLSFDDLVKVTVFLSDRRHRQENWEVRNAVLGTRKPALTIIITGIYDEEWLLEIEAIAAS